MADTLRQKLQALEVLRQKFLSKAGLLRDEVLKATISAEKFARLGPRATPAAAAPEYLASEAAGLEELARNVARWPAARA